MTSHSFSLWDLWTTYTVTPIIHSEIAFEISLKEG